MPATFNATDFEQVAVEAVTLQQDSALARLAMDKANELRAAGDTSTKPTPITAINLKDAEEYEDLAVYLSENGNPKLAQQIRARIARLQSQEENQ